MLSYLYRLASGFEAEHGFRANLIYLNQSHFRQLQTDLAAIHGLGELVRFLGMEVVVDSSISHPHLAYSQMDWQKSAAV